MSGKATLSGRATRIGVLLIWAMCAAVLLYVGWDYVAPFNLRDSDDALRLVQVRDWMAGQSWFDVTQYRINPPAGGLMHWSRLVDIPLAAFIEFFSLFATPMMAERLALTVVPLLTLLGLFLVVEALTIRVTRDRPMTIAAAAMLAMSVGTLLQFQPMRIDHHGWQILLDTTVVLLMIGSRGRPQRALAAGIVMAMSLTIALEGLPVAVAIAAVLALRFLGDSTERRSLDSYLTGLTGGCGLLLCIMLGWPRGTVWWCDAMSPAYLLPMIVATGAWLVVGRLTDRRPVALRIAGLAAAAGLGAVIFLLGSRQCAAGPFSTLDPIVYKLWYGTVGEGMPIWTQGHDVAVLIALQSVVGLVGTACAIRFSARDRRDGWTALLILQLASLGVSIFFMRGMGLAHVLALPGAAWLFVTAFRWATGRAHAPARVLLAVACFFLTPMGLELVANEWVVEPTVQNDTTDKVDARTACVTYRQLRGLDALPPTVLFTPFDIGPHIIAFTHHSVVATGHHRNASAMRTVITAFIAPPDQARAIIARTPARYLAFCAHENEVTKFSKGRPNSLMSALLRNQPLPWLQPVPMRPGESIRVWRILPTGQPGAKRNATPFMQ